MNTRTSWNDYFTGSPTSTLSKEYGERQTPSVINVYVLNSLFISITFTSGNGGALYCSNSVTYLLIESTSFFSCKASSAGGAIYFSNTNSGQCVLNEVCGYDCCTTGSANCLFADIYVYNVASSKNYVNYSSFVRCISENSGPDYTLRLYYGKICFPSVNLSMNKCQYRSAFICCPYGDSNSFTFSMTYSSVTDHIAASYTCIQFWTSNAKYEIKSCNILRNTQGSLGSEGTFYTQGNVIIYDSCILENTANYIFCVNSGTITLSNCTVDSTSNNGYLTTQNKVTKSFIHALNHMSTRNCHSEYDSAGTLTPIIQTPSSSNNRIHYTCERLNYRYQQGNFVSLTSVLVLIFNFIYPYSSNDSFY
jgi:hypothetical protein